MYPNGDLAANLVGFTTVNGNTRATSPARPGIEQSYNSLLAGRDGSEEVETGDHGDSPSRWPTDQDRPLVPGGNVRLTILASLQ